MEEEEEEWAAPRRRERDWPACRRIIDLTRATAVKDDSRPRLLLEYVGLLLAEQGHDAPAWAQLD